MKKRIGMFLLCAVVLCSALLGGCVQTESPSVEEITPSNTVTTAQPEETQGSSESSVEAAEQTVYEYGIGDIVYWHPGPTMGIFTEHDGRSISSGIEVLARMDAEGVTAFQTYDADVTVLFEHETDAASTSDTQGEQQLTITLNDTDVIQATLLDTPAAHVFAQQLPFTLDMTDYVNREKHAHLDFTIEDADLTNIQYPYEIGDIIYYPPGPTFAMYYDHDGREISAGMEVIARMDEAGVAALATYPDAVKVTVELSK